MHFKVNYYFTELRNEACVRVHLILYYIYQYHYRLKEIYIDTILFL